MIAAVTMVKDEADICAVTVGHMATQVDKVYVADNGSTDGTRAILERLPVPVTIIDDDEIGYYQSRKLSALAERARLAGAEWVVPFDADELWLAVEGTIGWVLERLPAEAHIAAADVFDHVATGIDPAGGPVESMGWRRRQRIPLPKVAVRAVEGVVIEQGNHAARFPGVEYPLVVTGQLQVRHYPYRTAQQMIRKARNGAAAYAATDLPEDTGAHWRGYGRLPDDELAGVFRRWFYSDDPKADGRLVFDPPDL